MAHEVSVYVEDYGTRKGGWLDLNDFTDYDAFWHAVARTTGYADEINVADVEGVASNALLSLRDIWGAFEILDNTHEPHAMAAYLAYHGWNLSMADSFDDAYRGEWDSLKDYALDFYAEIYGEFDVPGFHAPEPDMVAWSCDYYTTDSPNGGEYVFQSV